MCLSVRKTRFMFDWRLLVKERIAYIDIPLGLLGFLSLRIFGVLKNSGFWVCANHSTVENGGVCRGRSVAVSVGVSKR